MKFKLIGVLAMLAVVAGCSHKPETTGTETGATTSTQSGVTSTSVTPGSQADLAQNVGDRVWFDTDKSDLNQEARQTLDRQAAWLKRYPNVRFLVEGHCDERGTREYNMALGARRAAAVRSYLIALGIDAGRLQTVSYGAERPAVLGTGPEVWQQNRRAVSTVQGGPAS